jgi:hypothetical protein
MDLLAILPYYIEVALPKDTVSLSPSPCIILSDALSYIPSRRSFVSNLAHVSNRPSVPLCYNSTLLLSVPFLYNVSSPVDVRLRELSTIEVTYLSFQHSCYGILLPYGAFQRRKFPRPLLIRDQNPMDIRVFKNYGQYGQASSLVAALGETNVTIKSPDIEDAVTVGKHWQSEQFRECERRMGVTASRETSDERRKLDEDALESQVVRAR